MRNFTFYLAGFLILFLTQVYGQETFESRAKNIAFKIESVTKEEKLALKDEVEAVNIELEKNQITKEQADENRKRGKGPKRPRPGKGAIILDPADHRLGPWKNYCRPYPCVGGGKCWIFYVDKGGVTFDVLPNGVAVTREASGLLREFRIWLLAQGVIPPMPLPVYQMLIERERTALHRSIRDATGNPHLSAKVDARQARIDQMEKAWSSMIDQMSVNPASPLTRLSAPGLV